METKERKAVRGRREQLLTLVNGWDPAGRLEAGAPRNAYEFIVDPLLDVLSTDATAGDVSQFLDREIASRFGATPEGSAQFAIKAINWFRIASTE